jgi:hypothetical protein
MQRTSLALPILVLLLRRWRLLLWLFPGCRLHSVPLGFSLKVVFCVSHISPDYMHCAAEELWPAMRLQTVPRKKLAGDNNAFRE